jgi:hypothetical protein
VHLVAAVVVQVALAAPHRLPTGGRPKAAIPHLAHRILERLGAAAVAEVDVGACSAVPLAGGQSRDPMDSVEEVRLLETAGVALGYMVRQLLQAAEAADHGPCCGRGSSVREEAAARQLLAQKGVLRPEVRLPPPREGHPLVLPYQSQVSNCPKQVGDYTNPSIRDVGRVTKWTDQVGQLCCRSSHERRQ